MASELFKLWSAVWMLIWTAASLYQWVKKDRYDKATFFMALAIASQISVQS